MLTEELLVRWSSQETQALRLPYLTTSTREPGTDISRVNPPISTLTNLGDSCNARSDPNPTQVSMRLLNVKTWKLQVFPNDRKLPRYGILSHTWGAHEVTLQEFELLDKGNPSLSKIRRCSEQALKHGYAYIWVDTCCIDKTSSAELSEAINSMFRWYNQSEICYAYLVDVKGGANTKEFGQSRWFTRGWTLQELLAPRRVQFYNTSWDFIGDSGRLSTIIASVAGIRSSYLQNSFQSSDRIG